MPPYELEPRLARAGAGAGKTERLVREAQSLFKSFQQAKGRSPRMIICTFTNKARGELKTRLFKIAREELSATASPQRGALPGALFLQYIQSFALHVSTIDSILSLFLKKYGYKMSLSRDFAIETQANGKLFDALSDEFVFKKNLSLLKKLDYHFLKRLFLFYFKMRLIHGSVNFYNKKDFENFSYTRQLFLDYQESSLKEDHVFNTIEKSHLLKDIASSQRMSNLFQEEESFNFENFIPLFEEFDRSAQEFFPFFMERKKQSGILDQEDLIPFSLSLLREHPETAKAFSKEWDYWLIDEYQDTSKAQEQIIDRITGFKNVFCVGDPGQSIYLFRGADPQVFERRESKTAPKNIQHLSLNYRSSASLIHFYNDFFLSPLFMKFSPPEDKKPSPSKACVHFLMYEPEPKEFAQRAVFKALSLWIQKLQAQGENLSDIAVLSSKNEYLERAGAFLRTQKIPLILNSSRNFALKRLIKDALFLLKFLINPRDSVNLKALLRTPCFFMPDQELADACFDHFEYCKHQERISFWPFIKNNFQERGFARALQSFLEDAKKLGLVKTFEKALKESGLLDLALLQDPTGSSTANLWKLVSLLNEPDPSALDLFYSLMFDNKREEAKEAPPFGAFDSAVELMSIHKAKGLEFKHVAVLDFSLNSSSLQAGGQEGKTKAEITYDERAGKMAFAVPLESRGGRKIKPYPCQLMNKSFEQALLEEKTRLFYVALTRAQESLALFVPQSAPKTNSPLDDMKFFQKDIPSDKGLNLLEKQYDEKDNLASWRLNEGFYQRPFYSFEVKSCEKLCAEKSFSFTGQPELMGKDASATQATAYKPAETPQREDLPSGSFPSQDKQAGATQATVSKPETLQKEDLKSGSFPSQDKQAGATQATVSKPVETPQREDLQSEGFPPQDKQNHSKAPKQGIFLIVKSSKNFVEDFLKEGHTEEQKNSSANKRLSEPPTPAKNQEESPTTGESSIFIKKTKPENPQQTKEEIIEKSKASDDGTSQSSKLKEKPYSDDGTSQFLKSKETSYPDTESADRKNREEEGKSEAKGFIRQKEKNILFKKSLGLSLHGFLQKLSACQLEEVLSLVKSSPLSFTHKEQITKALKYITGLKQPDMSRFFKTGFAEWPFRLKKQNILLTGQIDLWAKEDNAIHLFDYKSSREQSLKTQKQLLFYGFVLDEIYRPKKLYMYEMYPLQQSFKKTLFDPAKDAQEINLWLKSLKISRP